MTTTAPALGLDPVEVDKADDNDLTLWSVTTILKVLSSEALLYWSAEQAAEAAIDNAATWQAMLTDRGRDETVKWLRDARFRRPKTALSAANLGSATHKVCEHYALTGERPDRDFVAGWVEHYGSSQVNVRAETDVIGRMLVQFDSWLQRFQPSYQATEVAVYHPTYGYAGQADAFLTIDGVRFVADYKTSRAAVDSRGKPKTPYPDQVGLQLAAYRNAEYAAVWRPRRTEKYRRRYYLLSTAEREMAVPVPEVDTGLCIQITPESCEAYPIRCDESVHHAFLYTLEAFRWAQQTSKHVMGEALERSAA
jgi:ATP-dependent exoDNAse (exonuclease V) beta subunit